MTGTAYSGAALRRSTWHFIVGKLLSAGLTFVLLLWLVRALPVDEYAAYVSFVAVVELAYALSFVGLPWLAARYLPEFRLHAPVAALSNLGWRLVGLHCAIACLCGLVLLLLLDAYLDQLRLGGFRGTAKIYLLVFIVESIGRFARDGVLSALLQQGVVQISIVTRSFAYLALIAAASFTHTLNIEMVAWSELIASLASTAIALFGLRRYLGSVQTQVRKDGWLEPAFWHMWPAALRMYGAQLMTLTYSPQVVLNMVQLWMGSSAAATFGFLRQLYDLVGRYLPATLLFSLVRPKLVASYVREGSIAELSRNANLAGKVSLLVLMPAVAFAAVGGEGLVSLLSGGKFNDTGLLFAGLILALVPFSQRQLLETVAVTTGQAGICTLAAIAGLSAPLLMFCMFELDMEYWAGVAGIALGHLIFSAVVLFGVTTKAGFKGDMRGFGKITAAGIASFFIAAALPLNQDSSINLLALGCCTLLGYLIAIWLLEPITASERCLLQAVRR